MGRKETVVEQAGFKMSSWIFLGILVTLMGLQLAVVNPLL